MARSLNKVQLIGNMTRDPEMKYTPAGTAVCTFGIATNRSWTTETGEKKEDADFHNIVAWNKLAEICAQLLKKGRKIYVEGRLSTSTWDGPDGVKRNKTEVVISDMIILDKKIDEGGEIDQPAGEAGLPEVGVEPQAVPEDTAEKPVKKEKKVEAKADVEVGEDDIPF